MKNKFKPVSISLSPNVQKDDVVLVLKLLFQPWKWKKGSAILQLEEEFKRYLGVKYAFSFNSGRSSMYAILKALDLPEGSDVLLQAFTCNAVTNPVLWAGLNPIYVDCGDDFNINTDQIKNKLTDQTGAIVVQHTFGLPANIAAIEDIVRHSGAIIIEDCAHALGAKFEGLGGAHVGTLGKAGFYSFSRDKVISSVYGGMAVTNDDVVGAKLAQLQKEFGQPGLFWIKQQLWHPVLLHYIILPIYNFFDLGKLFLMVSQWLHVLSKAVSWQEKRGKQPEYFPKALPNAMAMMALHQLKKLEAFNAYRKQIAEFYYKELATTSFGLPQKNSTAGENIFLRFVVTHPKAHDIVYESWDRENILLGNWYTSPVDPIDTNLEAMRYKKGECPNAERLSKITLNLPTHINVSSQDAKRIINFLKKWN